MTEIVASWPKKEPTHQPLWVRRETIRVIRRISNEESGLPTMDAVVRDALRRAFPTYAFDL